ncbi:DUF5362 family protein [Pedobacter mucosus]|uniref:DUF5362 family protein n=1 Tax=Pedobacter mucosus TaxID=2895286 RepID=UPI001EE46AFA|nr:DUF5362 family protein [Pedobacter mucosus]UKT64789.1 DUF5362 family protein [Pedobacter mucosus]
MEEFEEQEPVEVKLIVSEEMRSYIYDITKWTKFLSIVGFVFSAMLVLISLSVGALLSSNPELSKQLGPLAAGGSTILTIIYLIMALVFFYPSLLLSKFSKKSKQGVLFGDQESLNDAILNLKSLFKFWGIAAIIIIVGYFILNILVGSVAA